MAHYSIRELEHLSGIKAHTLRIWEQRYNILKPERTETNIRYYSDADLKAILNISLLNEHGYKISRIAKMTSEAISKEVIALTTTSSDKQLQINTMIVAMLELNEEKFERPFTTAVIQLGFEEAIIQVIYPLLQKIGILWQTNNINPAHEHFISNLVRQKLLVAIDGQMLQNAATAGRFLLFLPEGELHDIGLLFMNYLLRARKKHVLFTGQSLPFEDLVSAAKLYRPEYLCTILTYYPERDQLQQYLFNLSAAFPESIIFTYGLLLQGSSNLSYPGNVRFVATMTDFIALVNAL